MFTRNGAMAGIVTGAVTAGMGFGMAVPMVAYAAQTTNDGAQTELTDSQKSYLITQLQTIQKDLTAMQTAATSEGRSFKNGWLASKISEYNSAMEGYRTDIMSGDRAKVRAVKTALATQISQFTGAYDDDTEAKTAIETIPEGGTKSATFTAYETLQQDMNGALDAFDNIVEKNQDPDSAEFPGLDWSTMKVTTYTSTFEEGYGTYANFDLAYKRTAGEDGYIKWEMPQELADAGFTIVTTGMLAPQASIPTYGDLKGTRAPEMYVSSDKKSIIVEIPEQLEATGHANGTFSFAIRSDQKQTASGESFDTFLTAKTESGDYTHAPAPKALKGALQVAVADGYVKQDTMGTRDVTHTFTIKFNSNGGTVIPDRTVTDGNLANFQNWGKNLPSPSKTGFRFMGWFTDEACTKVFDPFQVELKNMTLYAKYVQTIQAESTNPTAPRTAPTKGDLVNTGEANAYIATVAAVTVGAGIAVTVLRRRSK